MLRAAWWVLLVGCTISEKALPGKLADVSCDQAFDCYEADATEFYGTKKECREDLEDLFEEFLDYPASCDYDGGNAYKCVQAARKLDCDDDAMEFDDPSCDDIWTCDE